MSIKCYQVITSIAAGVATASALYESHKIGRAQANAKLVNNAGKDLLNDTIESNRLNYPSEKYNKVKQDIFKFKMNLGYKDFFNKISGYLEGFKVGVVNNFSTLAFSALTFIANIKHKKTLSMIGVAGVGLSLIWNYIKNGTGLLEKNDYLKY